MKTYLTEKTTNGTAFAGPKIKARSWADAQRKAQDQGVTVIGVLA